jgi:hypothetical protein
MVWHRECVYSRWNESTPFFYRRYLPDYGVPPLRGSASVTSAYDAPPRRLGTGPRFLMSGISVWAQRWYKYRTGDKGVISYIALATGTIVASCSYVLAGRLAGLSAVILWIAGTAYYFMAPFHSFRVSSSSDLSALALYGMIGLVLAKTAPSEKQSVRDELLVPRIEPLPRFSTDLKTVLTDLGSSEVGEGLMLETKFLYQQRLRCSHPDAVRVLSDVLAEVLVTGRPIRLSIASGKRPGVDLLFVDAHRVWPPPTHQAIAIGRGDDECLRMKFFGWPSQVTATRSLTAGGHCFRSTTIRFGFEQPRSIT